MCHFLISTVGFGFEATWASWQVLNEADGEPTADRSDRVRHMAFRSDGETSSDHSNRHNPVAPRRDQGLRATLVQVCAERVVVERLVAQKGAKAQALNQRPDTAAVMTLSRHQEKINQVPQAVD